jgi:hypothetical protein
MQCADLENLKFYFWNQNQGSEFASMVYEARIPAINTWFTMTAYAYLPDPLVNKMYFDVQGPTVSGTNTIWRLSAFQAHRFDTLDRCVSFIKTGVYSNSPNLFTGSVVTNSAALTTTATDGFLYVPTCAGTPTGTPTAQLGTSPVVVDTTNNKLYFYSGGQWRDAGP